MNFKIILLILIFKPFFCYAQSDQLFRALAINKDSVDLDLLATKRIYKSQIIYAIPIVTEKEDGFSNGDLLIVKFDSLTQKIITKTRFIDFLSSDAIEIKKIWIDTAPYFVKNGVKAFGIKIRSANNSRAASAEFEELILIKEENGKFHNILKTTTRRSVFYGGGPCEENEGFTLDSYLIIDKKNITNQHYHIIEKLKVNKYTLTKECEGESQDEQFVNVFKFHNGEYTCNNRQTGD